jgi:hypothetical protein
MNQLLFAVIFQFVFLIVGLGYLMNVTREQLEVLRRIEELLQKREGEHDE